MSKAMPTSCIIAPIPESAEPLEYCTRWSRLDGNVLLSPEFKGLSSGAKVVYGYLGLFINHEDRSWQVSVGLLANYSGYTEKHVRRCLAEVEAAELLARRTVFWINQLGARQSANIYTLTTPPSLRAAPAGQLALWRDQEAPERGAEPDEAPRNEREREASEPESVENDGSGEEIEEVGTSAAAELDQVAGLSAPPDEVDQGGDPSCPPSDRPMDQPCEAGPTFPSETPSESLSPSQAPPPNPRPAGGGADKDQVWFFLDRYAGRSDEWWALAADGSCGVVGEVLGDLRAARKLGSHVSCRKRTIRPSLVAALDELAEVRAQREAEAQRIAEQQRLEAEERAAELARWEAEQARERAEQEQRRAAELARMNQEAAELAAELDDLVETLEGEESPLPDNPNPRITDARGLPRELRAAVFRFATRDRTIREARELTAELRSESFRRGVLRIARDLLVKHQAAPARRAA